MSRCTVSMAPRISLGWHVVQNYPRNVWAFISWVRKIQQDSHVGPKNSSKIPTQFPAKFPSQKSQRKIQRRGFGGAQGEDFTWKLRWGETTSRMVLAGCSPIILSLPRNLASRQRIATPWPPTGPPSWKLAGKLRVLGGSAGGSAADIAGKTLVSLLLRAITSAVFLAVSPQVSLAVSAAILGNSSSAILGRGNRKQAPGNLQNEISRKVLGSKTSTNFPRKREIHMDQWLVSIWISPESRMDQSLALKVLWKFQSWPVWVHGVLFPDTKTQRQQKNITHSFVRNAKCGGVQKSVGHEVAWKIGMLMCHPSHFKGG